MSLLYTPDSLLDRQYSSSGYTRASYGSYSEVNPDYAHLDRYSNSAAQKGEEADVGLLRDTFQGVVSGTEGFARSLVSLADWATFDLLPDEWSKRYFDRPQGTVGSIVEGITQFGLGMIPGLGVAGWAGKGAAALGAGAKTVKTLKNITAGATADFVAFDAHEERLSDLLASHELTRNVVTEYLASDMEDSQFEGRMKATLEGGAIGGILGTLVGGVKLLKKTKNSDGSPEYLKELNKAEDELKSAMLTEGIATPEGIELDNQVAEAMKLRRKQMEEILDTDNPNETLTQPEVNPESPLTIPDRCN